jgi:hypothetical protein
MQKLLIEAFGLMSKYCLIVFCCILVSFCRRSVSVEGWL